MTNPVGRCGAPRTEPGPSADAWCRGIAADRLCPGQEAISVREAFAEEAPRLLPLPENPYLLIEQVPVKVGKTSYIRFDLNDYSIPHTHVRRWLTVLADPREVRIADGQQVIACHSRSYDKGQQVEDEAHIRALVEQKRTGRRHRAADRLFRAAPASETLMIHAAERGDNLGALSPPPWRGYCSATAPPSCKPPSSKPSIAITHHNAVRFALERRRHERRLPPPVAVDLPPHVRARDIPVRPARLELYDQLKRSTDE